MGNSKYLAFVFLCFLIVFSTASTILVQFASASSYDEIWFLGTDYNGDGTITSDEADFFIRLQYSAPDSVTKGKTLTVKLTIEYIISGDYAQKAKVQSFDIENLVVSIRAQPDGLDLERVSYPSKETFYPGDSQTFKADLNAPQSVGTYYVVVAFDVIWIDQLGDYGSVNFDIGVNDPSYCLTTKVKESKCIIATATFGSELSPEVKFLRNFRDETILSTFAGSCFMNVFNAWYYSFSPSVASVIRINPTLKAVAKILIYPLIGILHITAMAYNVFSFNPELGVVLSGILASALIGVVYLSPIILLALSFTKRKKTTTISSERLKFIAIPWISSVILLVVSEITLNPILASIATSLLVLTTLTLFAIATAYAVVKHTHL